MPNHHKPWNYATEYAFETTPVSGNSSLNSDVEAKTQEAQSHESDLNKSANSIPTDSNPLTKEQNRSY